MSRAVVLLCSRRAPHVAVLALMSIGFAGCSSDMQSRLSENPFESTASVPPAQVERREPPQYARPQPQIQSQNLPPAIGAPQSYQSYPAASSGVSGGGRASGSYPPPPPRPIESTGSVPRSVAAVHPGQGTTIIVGTSDTLEVLAR